MEGVSQNSDQNHERRTLTLVFTPLWYIKQVTINPAPKLREVIVLNQRPLLRLAIALLSQCNSHFSFT